MDFISVMTARNNSETATANWIRAWRERVNGEIVMKSLTPGALWYVQVDVKIDVNSVGVDLYELTRPFKELGFDINFTRPGIIEISWA